MKPSPVDPLLCYPFSMNLKDELETVISEGCASLEEEARLSREFDSAWQEVRDGLIWSVLKEAREPFTPIGLARPHQENGCSNLLIFLHGKQHPDYKLKFCPKKPERQVEVTTYPENLLPSESLTLDNLAGDVIRQKIVAFTKAIFKHLLEQRRRPSSSGWVVGS